MSTEMLDLTAAQAAAAIDAGDGARVIWASPSAEGRDGGLGLPTWTGAFLKSASP